MSGLLRLLAVLAEFLFDLYRRGVKRSESPEAERDEFAEAVTGGDEGKMQAIFRHWRERRKARLRRDDPGGRGLPDDESKSDRGEG